MRLEGESDVIANEYEAILSSADPAWRREANRVLMLAQQQHLSLPYEAVVACDVHDLQRLNHNLQVHHTMPIVAKHRRYLA